MDIHMSLNISVWDRWHVSYVKHVFKLVSPALIHFHVDRSRLPCLCGIFHSTIKNLDPIYFIVQVCYECIVVSELSTHTPVGNNFIHWTLCLYMVIFVFYSSPKSLKQANSSLTLFSEGFLCIFSIFRLFCQILHSTWEIAQIAEWYFLTCLH